MEMHADIRKEDGKSGAARRNGGRPPDGRERPRGFTPALFLIAIMMLGLFFVEVLRQDLRLDEQQVALGATFSKAYAEELGLDWRETYLATLDDLGVRRFRIPAYWRDIEPQPDLFDFRDLDWIVHEASVRGAEIILTIGRKAPRWPECHEPEWAHALPEDEVRERILAMMSTVIARYKDEPAIVMWQVENEPLFSFGECPPPDARFLRREVEHVRSLDDRPIMITESGELSTWVRAAGIADVLGVSTYREVWTRYIGYFFWPLAPSTYTQRARAIMPMVDRIIVSELQAEPWASGPLRDVPIAQQVRLMNAAKLEGNVSFVRRIGFPEAYLWGVEWWYWLREQGHPELWDAGRRLYADPQRDR